MHNILTGTIKLDVQKQKEDCHVDLRLHAVTIKNELDEVSGMFVVRVKISHPLSNHVRFLL